MWCHNKKVENESKVYPYLWLKQPELTFIDSRLYGGLRLLSLQVYLLTCDKEDSLGK